ncbi:class I SAM-dependent methyltransferase [Ralstonia pseudosolanacearum]|uniref:class I SAM-dependent methyltransferase n=1 Tax=Ralstonia pseudosolanacearum TaxID=1310165 RepID=UPI003D17ABF8|nr:class I SAM-dependent methyltransferase [Candidatus Saccharibacteria bacterium]
MSTENEKTIEVYEKFGDKYLARNEEATKNDPRAKKDDARQKELLKTYVENLPKDAKIFEVGSAGGRDAKYLRSLGYENIAVSDVANYFLKKLEDEGFTPVKFDLIKDDFNDKYDFILCWAVLVHFTKDEAKAAILKMSEALNPGGRIALCVKHKEGHEEDWADFNGQIGAKRYFSYWNKDELESCMKESGFKNIDIKQHGGARACWLECCAEK